MQDYDIILQWAIPENFQGWQATPITIDYRTDTANLADNAIEIVDIIGTDGSPVTSIDSGDTPAASTTWVNDNAITFTGGTFTPGQYMTIRIRMFSEDQNASYVGEIKFNTNVK